MADQDRTRSLPGGVWDELGRTQQEVDNAIEVLTRCAKRLRALRERLNAEEALAVISKTPR